MFKKIVLENYRSFTHIELDLTGRGRRIRPYALIYGENGSGKSNLIDAVLFVKRSIGTLSGRDGSSDLRSWAADAATIGSDGRMGIRLEFTVDGRDAAYEMRFSPDGSLEYERLDHVLSERTGRYYEVAATPDGPSARFGTGLFPTGGMRRRMADKTARCWGRHSMLSIIDSERADSNSAFVRDGIRPEMISVLDYLKNMVVCTDSEPRLWPYDPVEGSIPAGDEGRLDAYGNAVDSFFTRLYTDVGGTWYEKTAKDGTISYRLMFRRRISGIYRDVPATKESAGTLKLLSLLPAMIACSSGSTVFLDDLDSGIHDKLVHDLTKELLQSIDGQLVATTHNTNLIRDADPEGVYVIRADAMADKEILSIGRISRTQRSHNNTDRYLGGTFGGVPYIGAVDFPDIAEELNLELRDA